jgi:thiol-disulfide isomerase/thioredoxin
MQAQLEAGIKVGSVAPVVVVDDLQGRPVDLGNVLGKKPVLLEFWATWCSLCKGLMPELQKIKNAYGDKVMLYGVNVTVNDSKRRIERYLSDHHPPFHVLYDDKGVATRAYDVPATSFIVVVDGAGKVVYTGSGEKQDLVGAVRKAAGPP